MFTYVYDEEQCLWKKITSPLPSSSGLETKVSKTSLENDPHLVTFANSCAVYNMRNRLLFAATKETAIYEKNKWLNWNPINSGEYWIKSPQWIPLYEALKAILAFEPVLLVLRESQKHILDAIMMAFKYTRSLNAYITNDRDTLIKYYNASAAGPIVVMTEMPPNNVPRLLTISNDYVDLIRQDISVLISCAIKELSHDIRL